MHTPIWKKWLSYIQPVTLEVASSDINDYLEVRLVAGQVQLCTERAVYSYERKYDNFRLLFNRLDFTKMKGRNVLALGLGLGSVILLLDDKKKNLRYTAVEIDDTVIALAEDYTFYNLDLELDIIHTSGLPFVESTSEKYDLVCMDIYIDDWIPDEYITKEYCYSLKSILSEDGVVVFNCPAFNTINVIASKKFYNEIFKIVFPQAVLIDVHKNYMLLSDPHLLAG